MIVKKTMPVRKKLGNGGQSCSVALLTQLSVAGLPHFDLRKNSFFLRNLNYKPNTDFFYIFFEPNFIKKDNQIVYC